MKAPSFSAGGPLPAKTHVEPDKLFHFCDAGLEVVVMLRGVNVTGTLSAGNPAIALTFRSSRTRMPRNAYQILTLHGVCA